MNNTSNRINEFIGKSEVQFVDFGYGFVNCFQNENKYHSANILNILVTI